jgi:hypothetical protein
MFGVVSLLEGQYLSNFREMWGTLQADCGFSGDFSAPIPHISWHVARSYNLTALKPILVDISVRATPLTIRTEGLGIFTGDVPIIYINVVKDAALLEFQFKVWQSVQITSHEASILYTPENWIPHITLARGDINNCNLGCLMDKLAFKDLSWELETDHIAVIGQDDEQVEKSLVFKFNSFGRTI